MDREIWNNLIIFAEVSRQGSFTKASRELGISPSAISHVIRKLEAKLDTRLLHRSTRSLSLTQEGASLLDKLDPSIVTLDETINGLLECKDEVSGRIKITSHRVAAEHAIMPRMTAFRVAFPQVTVELDINDGLIDFIAAGFDAGIRRGESLEQDMIAVPLDNNDQLIFVASPQYLQNHGEPAHPEELSRHHTISYRYVTSGAVFPWPLNQGGETSAFSPNSNLVLNDTELLITAAVNGFGIACITRQQANEHLASGRLQEVLHTYCTEVARNYLYFSGRRHIPAALRVFIDFMKVAN